MEVISASKRSPWTSGAKNITVYFKLTRSCDDCLPSWPILPLFNKIKFVSDIGLGLPSHPRQWNWLTIGSGYEMFALIIVLPKNFVSKFSDEFSKYFLQKNESSKFVFQWRTPNEFIKMQRNKVRPYLPNFGCCKSVVFFSCIIKKYNK